MFGSYGISTFGHTCYVMIHLIPMSICRTSDLIQQAQWEPILTRFSKGGGSVCVCVCVCVRERERERERERDTYFHIQLNSSSEIHTAPTKYCLFVLSSVCLYSFIFLKSSREPMSQFSPNFHLITLFGLID